jgi:hypothetical protein
MRMLRTVVLVSGVLLSLLSLISGLPVNAAVTIETTRYKGWRNCYRVSNGEVELIVTGDGPRVTDLDSSVDRTLQRISRTTGKNWRRQVSIGAVAEGAGGSDCDMGG